MHYSMADRVDVGNTLYLRNAVFRAGPADDQLNGCASVSQRRRRSLRLMALSGKVHDCFPADSFNGATSQPAVSVLLNEFEVRGNELELHRGAATIEDENIHRDGPLVLGLWSLVFGLWSWVLGLRSWVLGLIFDFA